MTVIYVCVRQNATCLWQYICLLKTACSMYITVIYVCARQHVYMSIYVYILHTLHMSACTVHFASVCESTSTCTWPMCVHICVHMHAHCTACLTIHPAGQVHTPEMWWHVPPFWHGQRSSHRAPWLPAGHLSPQLPCQNKQRQRAAASAPVSSPLLSCPVHSPH